MTYRELYMWGKERLAGACIADAAPDARLLLEAACRTSHHDLLAHGEKTVTPRDRQCYRDYITRREARVPLQYITGGQEFMGLPFAVTPDVLIPRPDTEILVAEILPYLADGGDILDIGCGSGCILLSLLHHSDGTVGCGIDISAAALAVAAANEEVIRSLPRADGRIEWRPVTWICADILNDGLPDERYDIIAANPPYIPSADIPGLMAEVSLYEPRLALDGGAEGLRFYRGIIDQSGQHLRPGGRLFFEIGHDQAAAVTAMMDERGFYDIRVTKDLGGHDRVVSGRYAVTL